MNLARGSHFSLTVEDIKIPQPLPCITVVQKPVLTCLTAECRSKFRVTVVLHLHFQSVTGYFRLYCGMWNTVLALLYNRNISALRYVEYRVSPTVQQEH